MAARMLILEADPTNMELMLHHFVQRGAGGVSVAASHYMLDIPWYTRPMSPQKLIRILNDELRAAAMPAGEPAQTASPRKT